jgi:hypothetical protein
MTTKSASSVVDEAVEDVASETHETSPRERASDMAVGMMSGMRGAAGNLAERLPDAATAARATVDEATRRMEAGSDQALIVGAAMSFGFAAGLFVGGAPRLIVTAALVPAVAMGMTLLDRSGRVTRAAGSRS